jgi:PilZ domain
MEQTVCFYCRQIESPRESGGPPTSPETFSLCMDHSIMVLARLRARFLASRSRWQPPRYRFEEHRRHPRVPVAWPVSVTLREVDRVTYAIDASAYGLSIATIDDERLQVGDMCRVALVGQDAFDSMAEVRHVSPHSIGLATMDRLPLG